MFFVETTFDIREFGQSSTYSFLMMWTKNVSSGMYRGNLIQTGGQPSWISRYTVYIYEWNSATVVGYHATRYTFMRNTVVKLTRQIQHYWGTIETLYNRLKSRNEELVGEVGEAPSMSYFYSKKWKRCPRAQAFPPQNGSEVNVGMTYASMWVGVQRGKDGELTVVSSDNRKWERRLTFVENSWVCRWLIEFANIIVSINFVHINFDKNILKKSQKWFFWNFHFFVENFDVFTFWFFLKISGNFWIFGNFHVSKKNIFLRCLKIFFSMMKTYFLLGFFSGINSIHIVTPEIIQGTRGITRRNLNAAKQKVPFFSPYMT